MKALLLTCVSLALLSTAASAKVPQNEQERQAAIQALAWRDGESLTLPLSRATLHAPKQVGQLAGPDSINLYEALNGVEAPPGTEATLYDSVSKEIVFYQKISDGYVRIDDWDDVDADAMLKAVTENTEAANIKRRSSGIPALHVIGWLERPHLDRSASVVRWSFEAKDDDSGSLVNSITLLLGRDGFEKLTWVGEKKASRGNLLTLAQTSFSFPSGGSYMDFHSGDKVAEYGIAGLVAAVLGAKVATKLGLLALIAVFAKKAGFLILVPLAFLGGWIKRAFSRPKSPAAPPSPPPLPPGA